MLEIVKGETEESIKHERHMLGIFSRWSRSTVYNGHKAGHKYRFDAFLYRDKEIVAIVESKRYSSDRFFGLNLAKYQDMMEFYDRFDVIPIFLVSHDDRIGYINLANARPVIRMCGGTPPHRGPNPDDIEPMAMFRKQDIIYLVERYGN